MPEAGLLQWWQSHKRHYPWRETRDPYQLAVTELMLVRTKADQVLRVWRQFFQRFPDIRTLAQATEDEVIQALSSLGLVWRARKIGDFAHRVLNSYGGRVPLTIEELRTVLPVGEYAAAAVPLQVKGEGALPVDTGIARLINRFYGLRAGGELRRNARVLEAVSAQGIRSRDFFYALLDLSWLLCLPQGPRNPECPLQSVCSYGQSEAARTGPKGQG